MAGLSAHLLTRMCHPVTHVFVSLHTQAASSRHVSDNADRGQDADHALPDNVRRAVGDALAAAPRALSTLLDLLKAMPPAGGAGSAAAAAPPPPAWHVLHVLAHAPRTSRALCEAAGGAGAAPALLSAALAARDVGQAGWCAGALLALGALAEGARPMGPAGPLPAGTSPQQHIPAFAPSNAMDELLRRLASLLPLPQDGSDPRVAFAAAGAIAACLANHYVGVGPSGCVAPGRGPGPTPPPPELLTPARLQALARVLKFAPSG